MARLFEFAWSHRGGVALLALLASAALAGAALGANVDQGTKRHRLKQVREAARMPGRLLT